MRPGRPKGSKHKLSEAFVAALAQDFDEHGTEAIRRVCENDPSTYLRVIASLVPKDFQVSSSSVLAAILILARRGESAEPHRFGKRFGWLFGLCRV